MQQAYSYLQQRHPGARGGLGFQNTEFALAEMYGQLVAARSLYAKISGNLDDIHDHLLSCSVLKLVCTELAVRITNQAIQFCGAAATSDELGLERFMRDARMLTLAGGSSEVLKRTIGRHLDQLVSAPP
jgi:alkylation response protein AidB-like acyl-CoA dehydrogenase